jgi:hypothetical protein
VQGGPAFPSATAICPAQIRSCVRSGDAASGPEKKMAPVVAAGAKCRNVMTLHCHHTVQGLSGMMPKPAY